MQRREAFNVRFGVGARRRRDRGHDLAGAGGDRRAAAERRLGRGPRRQAVDLHPHDAFDEFGGARRQFERPHQEAARPQYQLDPAALYGARQLSAAKPAVGKSDPLRVAGLAGAFKRKSVRLVVFDQTHQARREEAPGERDHTGCDRVGPVRQNLTDGPPQGHRRPKSRGWSVVPSKALCQDNTRYGTGPSSVSKITASAALRRPLSNATRTPTRNALPASAAAAPCPVPRMRSGSDLRSSKPASRAATIVCTISGVMPGKAAMTCGAASTTSTWALPLNTVTNGSIRSISTAGMPWRSQSSLTWMNGAWRGV